MSAVRPLKGQAGKFYIPALGKVISIHEWREDDKYDTVLVPAGAMAAGTQYHFFRDLANKDLIDTNFPTPRRLPAGEEMIITRVGVYIPTCHGNVIISPSDIKRCAEDGYVKFQVNQKDLAEGPITRFPTGYGLYGNTVENVQGIVSVGMPSTAAAKELTKPQFVTTDHDVYARLTFYDRAWIGVGVMPTFTTAMTVKAYLHGFIKSAVST